MAILCKDHNLLFVMAPRTGCTAIGQLLLSRYGGQYLPRENIIDRSRGSSVVRLSRKHCTTRGLLDAGVLTKSQLNELFVVSSVRNPFDSIVSLFQKISSNYRPLLDDPESWVNRTPGYAAEMKACEGLSFREWVALKYDYSALEYAARRLLRRLPNVNTLYAEGCDALLRFECLQESLSEAFSERGIPIAKVPVVNRTEARAADYRSYYDPRAVELVSRAFAHELRRFSYAFE